MRTILTIFFTLFFSFSAFALNPVKLNKLLGFPLFSQEGWQEEPVSIPQRLNIHMETTMFNNNPMYSGYTRIPSLGSTVNQIIIKCTGMSTGRTRLSSIQLVYANKGDTQAASDTKFQKAFRENANAITNNLKKSLGQPRRHKETYIWQLDEKTTLAFENQRNEYLMITIARQGSEPQLSENQQRQLERRTIRQTDFTRNIQTNNFGDCFIRNIPMVNQGNKGYCAPATIERCFRYYGISAYDMHEIAQICETGRNGGTSIKEIHDETKKILRRYSLGLKTINFSMGEIARTIDQGNLVFWTRMSSGVIEQRISDNTALREQQDPKQWRKILGKQEHLKKAGDAHMCLIIGYNRKTNEIAFSDSWGNSHKITWLSFEDAARITLTQPDAVTP